MGRHPTGLSTFGVRRAALDLDIAVGDDFDLFVPDFAGDLLGAGHLALADGHLFLDHGLLRDVDFSSLTGMRISSPARMALPEA